MVSVTVSQRTSTQNTVSLSFMAQLLNRISSINQQVINYDKESSIITDYL